MAMRSRGRTGATVMAFAGALEAACASSQPAAKRFRKRRRQREASGDAEDGKAVGEARARAAERFGDPGERQAGRVERVPERLFPRAVSRPVDGLRVGEIGKDPCGRFGYDVVSFVRHDRSLESLPAR